MRLARGMTQSELGRLIGVSFQQVQKYETGSNRVGAGRLQRIAEIFEVPLAALFDSPGRCCRPARSAGYGRRDAAPSSL
jgi:transcriptional regulator with XRE-family HTH domain